MNHADHVGDAWFVVNTVVDCLFFLDIIFIFNEAYIDEDFQLVDQRKEIAAHYLKGWFALDSIAIIPFDIIMMGAGGDGGGGNNAKGMVRLARVGRMYKLVKLTRLLRVLKVVKNKNKLLKYV